MNPRRIGAIFRKDLRDAVRDARVLVAILVPLGVGVLYSFMFQSTPTVPTVTVAYAAPDATQLPPTSHSHGRLLSTGEHRAGRL